MEGRLTGFSLNRDGSQNITVTVTADFGTMFDELKDHTVEVEIKKAQKHRSMEANRYAWVLIDQIAAKLHKNKSEVYREAIRDIGGVSKEALMDSDAVVPFREIWEKYWTPESAACGSTSAAALMTGRRCTASCKTLYRWPRSKVSRPSHQTKKQKCSGNG